MKIIRLFCLFLYAYFSFGKLSIKSLNKRKSIKDNKDDEIIQKSLVLIKSYPGFPVFNENNLNVIQSVGFFIETNLIVANKKSVPKSSEIDIALIDGTVLKGGVFYEDAFLPFSLIKLKNISDEELRNKTTHLNISIIPDFQLTENDELNLISLTTPLNKFIRILGKIISLNDNLSIRYAKLIEIKFADEEDLDLNSLLGSPIVNSNNEVIGIHSFVSDKINSYSLSIKYIDYIRKSPRVDLFVGDLGISLQRISIGQAFEHLNFNYYLNDSNKINSSVFGVSSVIPGLNSHKKIFYGDVLLKINNTVIPDDFLLLDSILNKYKNSKANLLVSRNGVLKNVTVPLANSQDYNIDRFVKINDNFYIHDITGCANYYMMYNIKGVVFNLKNSDKIISFIVSRINSVLIKNINELVFFLFQNCNTNNLIIEGYDYYEHTPIFDTFKLDIKKSIIEEKKYDYNKMEWANSKEYILTDICNKLNNTNDVNQIIQLLNLSKNEAFSEIIKDIQINISKENTKTKKDNERMSIS